MALFDGWRFLVGPATGSSMNLMLDVDGVGDGWGLLLGLMSLLVVDLMEVKAAVLVVLEQADLCSM